MGSLVNKYKLDLLWLCLVPKTFAICKPVDAIRYRKYARLLQKGHWAQILWLFYHLFVKMPIDAVLAMNFASVKLLLQPYQIQQLYPIIGTK
jgi:hypothetical protein